MKARVYQRARTKQKASVDVCDPQIESNGDILRQSEVRLDLNEADRVGFQCERPVFHDGLDEFLTVLVPVYKLATRPYFVGSGLKRIAILFASKGKDHSCFPHIRFNMLGR